jgi:hypothetical protein
MGVERWRTRALDKIQNTKQKWESVMREPKDKLKGL